MYKFLLGPPASPSILDYSMCLKNSCLLHTAPKARASCQTKPIFFLVYLLFITTYRTRLLRLEHQAWEQKDLYIITCFSAGLEHPVPSQIYSMCLKISCFLHTACKIRASSQTKPQYSFSF